MVRNSSTPLKLETKVKFPCIFYIYISCGSHLCLYSILTSTHIVFLHLSQHRIVNVKFIILFLTRIVHLMPHFLLSLPFPHSQFEFQLLNYYFFFIILFHYPSSFNIQHTKHEEKFTSRSFSGL